MKENFQFSTTVFRFKQWARKSYSIFNSIHKVVNIGVLSLTSFTSILGSEIITKNHIPLDSIHEIKEVSIVETAPLQIESKKTHVISLITKDEIHASTANSIDGLLEYVLNVDIRNRGQDGTQADLIIRGGNFDQNMILLNGINITDPQTGHYNLVIPIPISAIDHIEILSGPGAIKWGSNAFSGAINIVTNPQKKQTQTSLAIGQHNYRNIQIGKTIYYNKTSHLLFADGKSSNGYTNNTDFKNTSLFYHGNYVKKYGTTEWQLGYTNRKYGAQNFYTPNYPNQYEEETVNMASIKWKSTGNIKFEPSLYYRQNKSHFELFRKFIDAPIWYENHNYHKNEVIGSNLLITYSNSWFITKIGCNLRNERILSNILGKPLKKPIAIKYIDEKYTNYYSRTNLSYFIEQKFSVGPIYAETSLMINNNTAISNSWDLFPGLKFGYSYNNYFTAYAYVNRTMRMPTFTDLYYNGPNNIGNVDLIPESAINYEVGTKYTSTKLSGHISYFFRKGKNLIDWIKKNESEPWTSINYSSLNTQGVEINSSLNIQQIIKHSFFIKNINLSYSYLDENKENEEFISGYEIAYLKHKFNTKVTHNLFHPSIRADWNICYQYRNGTYENYKNSKLIGVDKYRPFWLVSIKASWKIQKYNIFTGVNNLFNKKYNEIGSIIQPGIFIDIGLKWSI